MKLTRVMLAIIIASFLIAGAVTAFTIPTEPYPQPIITLPPAQETPYGVYVFPVTAGIPTGLQFPAVKMYHDAAITSLSDLPTTTQIILNSWVSSGSDAYKIPPQLPEPNEWLSNSNSGHADNYVNGHKTGSTIYWINNYLVSDKEGKYGATSTQIASWLIGEANRIVQTHVLCYGSMNIGVRAMQYSAYNESTDIVTTTKPTLDGTDIRLLPGRMDVTEAYLNPVPPIVTSHGYYNTVSPALDQYGWYYYSTDSLGGSFPIGMHTPFMKLVESVAAPRTNGPASTHLPPGDSSLVCTNGSCGALIAAARSGDHIIRVPMQEYASLAWNPMWAVNHELPYARVYADPGYTQIGVDIPASYLPVRNMTGLRRMALSQLFGKSFNFDTVPVIYPGTLYDPVTSDLVVDGAHFKIYQNPVWTNVTDSPKLVMAG